MSLSAIKTNALRSLEENKTILTLVAAIEEMAANHKKTVADKDSRIKELEELMCDCEKIEPAD